MKKLMLLFSIIFYVSSLLGQNIKNKYMIRTTDEGSILFFFPQKGYKSKALSNIIEYDITYSTVSDSVTINFTYKSNSALPLDSTLLKNQSFIEKPSTSMIYLEPNGNKWEQRASMKISDQSFRLFMKEENPVDLYIYSKGNEYKYEMSPKNWKKNMDIIKRVYEVFDLNIASKKL